MKKYENLLPEYPSYFVTKSGKVYSCRTGIWKLRRQSKSNTDRWRVRIKNRHGFYKWEQVSRLVATAYLPNPHNLPVVMHLDDNPNNNRVGNLRWATQSENIQSAYDKCRAKTPLPLTRNGELHPSSKITNRLRYILVDLHLTYQVPLSKLSVIFNISSRHLSELVNQYKKGTRWSI